MRSLPECRIRPPRSAAEPSRAREHQLQQPQRARRRCRRAIGYAPGCRRRAYCARLSPTKCSRLYRGAAAGQQRRGPADRIDGSPRYRIPRRHRDPTAVSASRPTSFGPGVADMKSGLVVNTFVWEAFRRCARPARSPALHIGRRNRFPSSRPIIEAEVGEAGEIRCLRRLTDYDLGTTINIGLVEGGTAPFSKSRGANKSPRASPIDDTKIGETLFRGSRC